MKISLSAVILLFVILQACENSKDSREETGYPLQVGNSWEYLTTYTFTDDSGNTVPPLLPRDSVGIHVQIDRKELLNNSLQTFVFRINEKSSQVFGEEYYQNKSDGLYNVAYKNAGAAPLVQPKQSGRLKYLFKNRTYASISEIMKSLLIDQTRSLYHSADDSVLIEEIPLQVLKYPLAVNSQWIYREHDPWRIEKKVERSGSISVPAGIFTGYSIRWLYDRDGDEEWDEDIYILDFIAEEGLIQRDIFIRGMVITTTEGVEIGTFDYHEKSQLTNYQIQDND